MRLGLPCMLLLSTLAACAPTIGPVSLPVEVLVVLDRQQKFLLLIPVDSLDVVDTIPLKGIGIAAPSHLAVHGSVAAVGYSDSTAIETVNLAQESSIGPFKLDNPTFNPMAAVGFDDDGVVYAALPFRDRVATLSPPYTNGAGLNPVAGGPQGFVVARGTVFVVAGNRQACYPVPQNCGTPSASSFLISATSTYKDSLALSGPGNASAAVFAPDGFIYVLSSGDGAPIEGRLSQFDPVQRVELNLFGGFGPFPQYLASDGADRLFVASVSKGLMVFNTRSRSLEIGSENAIPLTRPQGLSTDELGRVYVLEAGGCTAGQQGQVRVFGTDLVERKRVPTGICPVAIAVTQIPSDIFHFKN